MTAERIRERIAAVRKQVSNTSQDLEKDPDNLVQQLTLASLNAHLAELKEQLEQEYATHGTEVVEVRLVGKRAENARVPIRLLSQLSEHLMRTILTAATHIKTGRDYRRTPASIEDSLNLSFAALSPGSSRLFFTVDSKPDLFGESLAENTLTSTFSILAKESFEDLMEEMDSIGIKSLKNIHDMFGDVLKEKLELEISWTDVETKAFTWKGNRDSLSAWKKRIERIRSSELPGVSLDGVVNLISLSGRLEIMTDDGHKVKSVFPMRLLDDVRQVTINDNVRCNFARRQVIDISRGIERTNYILQSIERHIV